MARRITQLILALGMGTIALLATLVLLVNPATAADQCVHPTGAGSCLSNIQAAIDAAVGGDTIRVVQGTYNENVAITKDIVLEGGYQDQSLVTRDPDLYLTTIDGGGVGVVISITNNADVTVDGFTITGGDGSDNIYVSPDGFLDSGGGGIFVREATALIRDDVISGNVGSRDKTTSGLGGGILVISSTSPVRIYDNLIQANVAQSVTLVASEPISNGVGGGIAIATASSAVISGNQVISNVALQTNIASPGASAFGGGIASWGDSLTVENNTIQGNLGTAEGVRGFGGGIVSFDTPVVAITNNAILENTGIISGSDASGGGAYLGVFSGSGQRLTLTGNWVMSNTAGVTVTPNAAFGMPSPFVGGGGLRIWGGGADNDTLTLENNHLLYNVGAVYVANLNGGTAEGGGLSTGRFSTTLIISNEISFNTAARRASTSGAGGWGGGVSGGGINFWESDDITIQDSRIENNVAVEEQSVDEVDSGSDGGGLSLASFQTAVLRDNWIVGNVAAISGSITSTTGAGYHSSGGGITVGCWDRPSCSSHFIDNTISDNVAAQRLTLSGTDVNGGAGGGGLSFHSATGLLQSNLIRDNTSNLDGDGWGGGLNANESVLTMDANLILGNRMNPSYDGGSGGVWVWRSVLTSTNDVFARNYDAIGGGGDPSDSTLILINDTLYDNGRTGVRVNDSSTAYVTNTIVDSHDNGLEKDTAATLIEDYNLLNNTTNYGDGISAGSHTILDQDPLFVNAVADRFHLRSDSPAVDKGTSAGAPSVDFEGDPRPQEAGFDIGADEFRRPIIFLPIISKNATS